MGTAERADRAKDATAASGAESDAWRLLQQQEADAIKQRRAQAFPDPGDRSREAPRVGLALSGGGIRSATFCIGLLRGLAQNGLLRRFDYLSTVSGGGYAGAAFGRLISALGIAKAEQTLSASDSLFLTWLRRNGRYLSPAGARDFGMAIATYLRAGIAVHLELGFLALLVGLLVILPAVWLPSTVALVEAAWQPWCSAWWPIAVAMWLLLAPGAMLAYWPLRLKTAAAEGASVSDALSWRSPMTLLVVLIVMLGVALASSLPYLLQRQPRGLPPLSLLIALVAVGSVIWMAVLISQLWRARAAIAVDVLAAQRNALTRSLRAINKIVLALFCLGVFDWVTAALLEQRPSEWLAGGIGFGALLTILIRAFAEPMQKLANSSDGAAARWTPRLISWIGLLLGLMVLLAWITLLQWLVFDERSWSALDALDPMRRWFVFLVVVALWMVLTWRNRETVNTSSMHGFYRARLTRAYVSIGNALRFGTHLADLTRSRSIDAAASVTDVIAGDDVALRDYQPERSGGPIHLVCSCLNQTVDDRSDLYNADRKGAVVVASARAIEVGLGRPHLAAPAQNLGSLGHWIATSGAAAAPGAGSNTTAGWALLLFMAGARLGYWLDASSVCSPAPALRRMRDSKSGLLISEAFAWFGGAARRWWYLSDGGHFDNTGVYPLLRRELDCIVLADCGADSKFEFADIENLIRKARIDFDADIEFYTRSEAERLLPIRSSDLQVLAPEDMADNQSVRGVLLARICYHRSHPEQWKTGSLLIVKPNLHEALDRDLLAYARRNPSFPQQPTGDQFFDEAQWESYHRLGEDFGRALTRTFMNRIPGWRVACERPDHITPLRPSPLFRVASDNSSVPFWKRGLAATAIGTGLGLGAIGTLLLPTWQALESIRERQKSSDERAIVEKAQANKILGEVGDDVNAVIAAIRDCQAATSSTEACKVNDLSSAQHFELRQIYRTDLAYPLDGSLQLAHELIIASQAVCATQDGICSDRPTPASNLCRATCDRPGHVTETLRWTRLSEQGDDWTNNPAVLAMTAFADRVLGTRHAEDRYASEVEDVLESPVAAPPPMAVPRDLPAPPPPPPALAPIDEPRITAAVVPTARPTRPRDVDDADSASPPSSNTPPESAAAPEPIAGSATAGAEWKVCLDQGQPMTIYVQIYDEELRAELDAVGVDLLQHAGLKNYLTVAGIENVTRSALQRGSQPPRMHRGPTLIVHRNNADDLSCADQLAQLLQPQFNAWYPSVEAARISVRRLPPSLNSARHVIELWLPPAAPASQD